MVIIAAYYTYIKAQNALLPFRKVENEEDLRGKENDGMETMGRLTLVGTPIGNLSDLSPRAVEALKACDFIAAEDTRVTLTLLNHFGIKKPAGQLF